jgi:hypothetical protein
MSMAWIMKMNIPPRAMLRSSGLRETRDLLLAIADILISPFCV